MSKYHINPSNGKPGICTATVKGCKYAADDGTLPQHYNTKEEAYEAYAKENSIKNTENTLSKPKISELNKLAKNPQTTEDLNKCVQFGKDTTFKLLVNNDKNNTIKLSEDNLKDIYNKTNDQYIKNDCKKCDNFPAELYTDQDYYNGVKRAYGTGKILNKIASDNSMDDNKIKNLLNSDTDISTYSFEKELSNPNNNISSGMANNLVKNYNANLGAALIGNKININDYSYDDVKSKISPLSDISRVNNSDTLHGIANKTVDSNDHQSGIILSYVVNNKNTSNETLEYIAKNSKDLENLSTAIYNNPNINSATKDFLEKNSFSVQSQVKVNKILNDNPDFKNKVVVKSENNTPRMNRGYSEFSYNINKDLVEKYDLSENDLSNIITGGKNGGKYDKENGIFVSTFDSTD